MKKFRFHLIGLVHLPTSREYMSCAFTQKNMKLAEMLMSLGHEVYVYGAKSKKGDIPVCTEFIETHQVEEIAQTWGDGDNRFEIGYDWTNTDFRHDFNTERTKLWHKFNAKCLEEIKKRKKPDDFLLLTQGYYQRPIADSAGLFLRCEPGIGYRGSLPQNFRAFESAYIQNFTYGSEHPFECINGSYYDRVIPNYFDSKDFEPRYEKDDYFLFIGRMIKRKGIITAYEVAKALNKKLIIVGQGASVKENGHLVPNEYPDFDLPPATWEYYGYADVEARKRLMAGAILTFTPTEYLECFAGTHVESRLSGTPVLTTDFAVYPGTVVNGFDGYRCNTLDDFVWAAKDLCNWSEERRKIVRERAERYLMDSVRWDYQRWFDDLYCVWESSRDKNQTGWHRIRGEEPEWRSKVYW